MRENGFVYVLINPSMPGVVKVGKTTRDPQERIHELSSATGVPTPFMLVYKEWFADCSWAEDYIHSILDERGYRFSKNREFFAGPVDEIISVVQMAKIATEQKSGIDAIAMTEVAYSEAAYAYELYEEAMNYYLGSDDYLQDDKKAITLFKRAARLGNTNSYLYLGKIYRDIVKKTEQAVDYFVEGARRGNNYCNAELGMTFLAPYYNHVHKENGEKCWDFYFQNVNTELLSRKDIWFLANYIGLIREGYAAKKNVDLISFAKPRMVESLSESIQELSSAHEPMGYYLEAKRIDKEFLIAEYPDPEQDLLDKYTDRFNAEIFDLLIVEGITGLHADVIRGPIRQGAKAKLVTHKGAKTVTVKAIYKGYGTVAECSVGDCVSFAIDGLCPKDILDKKAPFLIPDD